MIICPNLKNPDVAREFNELKLATSELAAYHIWSLNNGHAIDKAPNGALSKLFLDLLDLCGGNRTKAILAKAKVYGNGFINWFGDWTDVDNSETFIFYQGRRSEDIDDRKYNYWTIDEEDAKRNYGQFIRNRRINTKNFLKKHKVVGRHVNPDGTKYYDFAWTDEYKAINEEFKQKYGYKYGFDILDNSKEGLVKQKQFFEFVESKGYSGYREYMKETPDNPYVVTFGNTNDAVSKVVDKNGEPLVVYHGTLGEFSIFDFNRLGEVTGQGYYTDHITGEKIPIDSSSAFFFTDNKIAAQSYKNLAIYNQNNFREAIYRNLASVFLNNPYIKSRLEFDEKQKEAQRDFIDNVLSPHLKFNVREQANKIIDGTSKLSDDKKKELGDKFKEMARKIRGLPDARSVSNQENSIEIHKKELEFLKANKQALLTGEDIPYFKHSVMHVSSGYGNWAKGEIYVTIGRDKETNKYYVVGIPNSSGKIEPGTQDITDNNFNTIIEYWENGIKQNTESLNNDKKLGHYNRGNVLAVFLNIKNPLEHDYNSSSFPDKYLVNAEEGDLHAAYYGGEEVLKKPLLINGKLVPTAYVAARQVRKAKKDGNDGVIYKNVHDPFGMTSFGIFGANQIKSATDNNGEFSRENNDIHFAISEESNTRERTDEETSIVQLLIDYIKSIGIPVHNRQEMIQKLGYSLVSWYTASTENDNIQMMVVGEKGAKRLDSAEEATTRMDNLSVANEMEKAGKDALTIKMATGWERGVDGKWRYETNDIKYKSREITGRLIKASHNTDSVQEPVRCKLSDILSDSKNQPEDTIYNIISSNPILRELNLEFSSNKYINGADMMYNPRTNTIYIGNFFLGDLEAKNTWYATLFAKELTHELQHVLQTSEGFEFGTSVGGPVSILQYDKKLKQAREYVKKQIELKNTNNVDYEALLTELNSSDFDKKLKAISFVNYYRNAGEVEARTSANRRALSPEERRNSLFTDDMYKDVAKEDLIFLQERLEDIPFITPTGEIYGFVDNNGEIYLDETVISSEHPIHEFTHLWDKIIQQHNKKLWNRGVKLMKQIPLWKQIEESKHYGLKWKSTPGMTKSRLDNLIASEVHARLTGENGSLIIENIAKEKGSSNIVEKLKNWISEFWQSLKETFGQWSEQDLNDLSIEDFINMPIRDLIDFDKFKNLYSGEFNTSLQVKDQLKSLGEQLMKQC